MITEEKLKKLRMEKERAMQELQEKAGGHQQQVVAHGNELKVCRDAMLHLAGEINMIDAALAPAEPATSTTEQPAPARSARKRNIGKQKL